MSENSKIEWTDHTFNPWIGCTKVSPACDHCYAEARMDNRLHVVNWGAGQPRKRTSAENWREPIKWNARKFYECSCGWRGHEVSTEGTSLTAGLPSCPVCDRIDIKDARQRVFCASLADVFDNEVPPEWRRDLFALISATPNLDWLLLTKRIGNAVRMLPPDWGDGYPNAWLGISVVNQEEADRDIPKLLRVPAAVRFLSMEPLLGPVDLSHWIQPTLECAACGAQYDLEEKLPAEDGYHWGADKCAKCGAENIMGTTWGHEAAEEGCPDGIERDQWDHGYKLHWVIVGGESGPHARPMHPDWVRSLRDQCAAANVPFFFKQWGEWLPGETNRGQFDERPMHAYRRCDDHSYQWPRHGERQNFGTHKDRFSGDLTTKRIGKKAAGRLLDGCTHDEFPKVAL